MELPAEIFEAPVNVDLMHQAYVQQMANARLGTHETKTRSEVAGGGRSRGSKKGPAEPVRVPPVLHNGCRWQDSYAASAQVYPAHAVKMRRAALRSALSAKAAEAGVVVVDELVLEEPKTRLMAQALNTLVGEATALVLVAEKDADYDMVMRSANNLPDAKLLMANYLNIRDLLGYEKLVMPLKALDVLKSILV